MKDSEHANANDEHKRGVKRKRTPVTQDLPQDAMSQESYGTAKNQSKLEGKLHHDFREVKKAAKKAKSFETQRLIKHIRSLRLGKGHSTETLDDLDAQLKIIKSIDPEYVGTTAFERKVRKDRALSGHDALGAALHVELEASGGRSHPPEAGTIQAKVLHRLLSSRLLAQAVNDAIEDLRRVVLGDNWVPKTGSGGQGASDNDAPPHLSKRSKIDMENGDDLDEESQTGTDDLPNYGAADNGKYQEAEGEDDWESITAEPEDDEYNSHDSDTGTDTSARVLVALTSSLSGTSGVKSTFLPSLSVGFVPGDSADSDWSDREADIADGSKKKNRRGQRARRAIWEKKYGQNANHKKRERAAAEAAVTSKARKSQVARQLPHRSPEQSRGTPSRSQSRKGEKSPPQGGEGRRVQLHPSWEAKKRLKEKELTAAGLGTKIKFEGAFG